MLMETPVKFIPLRQRVVGSAYLASLALQLGDSYSTRFRQDHVRNSVQSGEAGSFGLYSTRFGAVRRVI